MYIIDLHNTYCHVLFLFTLLIYLYHLSETSSETGFSPLTRWIRTKARTAELAPKYIKRLSDINYRTWTHSNCVREIIDGGRKQGWLSTIPTTCHKLSHWSYMALAADSVQRYFRTLQSELWCWNNIDIWYARNRRTGWTDILFKLIIFVRCSLNVNGLLLNDRLHLLMKIEKQDDHFYKLNFLLFYFIVIWISPDENKFNQIREILYSVEANLTIST